MDIRFAALLGSVALALIAMGHPTDPTLMWLSGAAFSMWVVE